MVDWKEVLRTSSPEYVSAFTEGYECAKKEIDDKLKTMEAYRETSATVEG